MKSSSFPNNGQIAKKFTLYGENISPELEWSNPPPGTKSFALIVDDPDAKKLAGYTWVHWMVKDIPVSIKKFSEGGFEGTQIVNHFDVEKYMGPKPPKKSGKHHYHFTLYALSIQSLDKATSIKTMYE